MNAKALANIVKDRTAVKIADVAKVTQTDLVNGLTLKQVEESRRKNGVNKIPQRPPTAFCKIYADTLKDPVLIILIVAAIVSITVGAAVPEQREELGYIDGIAIVIAVLVVSFVGSTNDYQKEKQFRKLNAAKESRCVEVIRNGAQQSISIYDLVVGDILCLMQGDALTVDALITTTQMIKMNESSVTGESDMLTKTAEKPWIVSGSLVQEGSGRCLVIAVGIHSIHGEMMMALREDSDLETPLQTKLNYIVKVIGYVGIGMALATFFVLVIRFLAEGQYKNKENFVKWINYIILAVTIIVVAIPEGLPLAVTISLAFSMKKMIKDQCLVRQLQSCETCGSVSVICSDKTGTLTKNEMNITNMWTINTQEDSLQKIAKPSKNQLSLYQQIFCSNAAFSTSTRLNGKEVVGSKTTGAFLLLSRDYFDVDYETLRNPLTVGGVVDKAIVQQIDFSSERKRSSMLIDMSIYKCAPETAYAFDFFGKQGRYLSMCRGASEIMLQRCVQIFDQKSGQIRQLNNQDKQLIQQQINSYANKSLRTLIATFKIVNQIPATEEKIEEDMEKDMVFLCLVGIQDPLRDGVPAAILKLKIGGIRTIMVTGDNYNTAVAISKDAHIIDPSIPNDQLSKFAIEGSKLRNMTDEQVDELLKTLCCVARCQPTDKYRVVQRLQHLGNVVAATGDGSNDAPQLKEADVGLAMGITGTEIAKEASDIIILDDNFCSIVQAVAWGRAVLANVRKFIQFQLIVNVVALIIAFFGSAVFTESPLTSIQLLYVNLLMDSLGSLALATEGPSDDILEKQPVRRNASIITPGMLRNIIGMSIFNLLIIFLMLFDGVGDVVCQTNMQLGHEQRINYRYTSIYNFFIFAQILNLFGARRYGNERNVFNGILKNALFWVVFVIVIVLQILIMFCPGLRTVFKIYECEASDTRCNGVVEYGISWQTWLINIFLAIVGQCIRHLLIFIKTKEEFKAPELKTNTQQQTKSKVSGVMRSKRPRVLLRNMEQSPFTLKMINKNPLKKPLLNKQYSKNYTDEKDLQ